MKNGDEAAFCILYDNYHAILYRNVIKLVHAAAEAQDIVQEVFITLWEQRSSLDISRPVNGWLFTLSYNRTVNHLRKKLREESRSRLIADLSYPDTPASVDERLVESQWQLMQEAVAHLSPQKKKVFELCKLEGKSYDKAAFELGLSRHTVAEYLQEAMAFIREYVRRHPAYSSSSLAVLVLEIFFK
jgi:RNA polymerase sigma-70 factor (ECF subfamily)